MNIMKQPKTKQITIKIYPESNQGFLATINDGWWIAYGKTAKDAAKRVEKRFNTEMRYK